MTMSERRRREESGDGTPASISMRRFLATAAKAVMNEPPQDSITRAYARGGRWGRAELIAETVENQQSTALRVEEDKGQQL